LGRALGKDPRKDVAHFPSDFPGLADDLELPDLYDENDYFSSVMRVGSPGLHLWTHYDAVRFVLAIDAREDRTHPLSFSLSLSQMDNALVQIAGTKRVVLFPPSDADCLYLKGDKSQVLDIDDPDMARYPLFKNAHPFECTLQPG
jgi:tRNA wybutosine-synthesizing protein 5